MSDPEDVDPDDCVCLEYAERCALCPDPCCMVEDCAAVHIDPTCPVHGHWVWLPIEERTDA